MTTLRLLLVEDSEDDALLLARQLRAAGYDATVKRVETREEMSRALDDAKWDIVITDYALPGFDALGALALFREKQLDIPFIILSGTIGEATAVEAMRAGAHDYIMKGSAARLVPAIERELREAGERATKRRAERRFRSLIEHSSDITTVVDLRGRIIYQSPSVKRLLGHVPEDLVGRSFAEFVHDEDAPRTMQAIAQTGADAPPSFEFRFREPGGGWRILEAIVTQLVEDPDVGGVVLNCRDITARKQDEETIRHLAFFDALTGLPNRMLFGDRVAQALAHAKRHGEPGVAVMFLDVDRFKTINDTLGHGAGDELLRAIAHRLPTPLREEDTVARLGGDEFLFLVPGIASPEVAALVAGKLLATFREPFEVLGNELHVTASMGIVLFPGDGTDPETLIRNADTALYRAKESGRNRYQLYAPEMNAKISQRLKLENELRRAIDRDELALFYQPLVSIDSGAVTGLEALIRWKNANPAEFIHLAEETGLIVPITRWVLRTACTQMRAWQSAGIAPATVSVNISAYHFNEVNLPEMVADALAKSGLAGEHLCLELTESVMMEDADATIETLTRLKTLGVSISMDDFGTGYSSLSYLKRLPIDTLKIDRSFVRDIPTNPDDAAIAVMIIGMAHDLGLSVVAEGVETEEQRAFLRSKRCDVIQGYLVSKPQPAPAITDFLAAASRKTPAAT